MHPGSGSFTAIDLSLCHPSLYLDYEWEVCEDSHNVMFDSFENSEDPMLSFPETRNLHIKSVHRKNFNKFL